MTAPIKKTAAMRVFELTQGITIEALVEKRYEGDWTVEAFVAQYPELSSQTYRNWEKAMRPQVTKNVVVTFPHLNEPVTAG